MLVVLMTEHICLVADVLYPLLLTITFVDYFHLLDEFDLSPIFLVVVVATVLLGARQFALFAQVFKEDDVPCILDWMTVGTHDERFLILVKLHVIAKCGF